MTSKLKTPPKEVSNYFETLYPKKKGFKHNYYWYWGQATKKTKIYGCNVSVGTHRITQIEAVLEWYSK